MDIAALSVAMSQTAFRQQASTQVMNISMDQAKQQGEQMAKMLETSVAPHVGGSIDIRA
ncbi:MULTISPECIES: YjfB family protein [Saccharibacillus]|uniref:Putative motility protein n=1 Tax=Saccharibacillus brassicae TaxID=2583377 RepID=A0A4Y6USX5_SACBS|nr:MULTISPECIES: YjfB family protein [Saccharibacillus]MWJ31713.1 putative motility protein [Saccharibacillus sp. WB 17]QDH19427.1 putative motility protein [Saccharibacillus brassicae]